MDKVKNISSTNNIFFKKGHEITSRALYCKDEAL